MIICKGIFFAVYLSNKNNTMKTAEEYIMEDTTIMTMAGNKQKVAIAMIEFAKMHCRAQAQAINESTDYEGYIDEETIINAYPLTNIK